MGKKKMGKKMKRRLEDAAEVGVTFALVDFTKRAAKDLGLSRKEANALAYGMYEGAAVGFGIAAGTIDVDCVEQLAVERVVDAASEYAEDDDRDTVLVIDVEE